MLLTHGPSFRLTLDNLPADIEQALEGGKTILSMTGPQRTGDSTKRYSPLSPEGLPSEDDESQFAVLYRKLEAFARDQPEGKFTGPFGEDHPALYFFFEYVYRGTELELLERLKKSGVDVRILETNIDLSEPDTPAVQDVQNAPETQPRVGCILITFFFITILIGIIWWAISH